MGEWTPAFKEGGVQEKSNYRPSRPITSLIAVDKALNSFLVNKLLNTLTQFYIHVQEETLLRDNLTEYGLETSHRQKRVGVHSLNGYEQGF